MDSAMDSAPPTSFSPSPPPPQQISTSITLQKPLTRIGRGPGLVIVLDHHAEKQPSSTSCDPPPLQKWAEEGFAVVQVLIPGKADDGDEFPLNRALEVLKGCDECEGEGVGVVLYVSRIPFYVEEVLCLSPSIKAIVSYGGRRIKSISPEAPPLCPQLVHTAGALRNRADSTSIPPNLLSLSKSGHVAEAKIKTYRYLDAERDAAWILPSDEAYHAPSANLAHTRSLHFLKPLLDGPFFDLEEIWEEHCQYEFVDRDVDRTMATMVATPFVNHIPTLAGGVGNAPLAAFYANHFIHSNPADTALQLVSRTVGQDRIVDEFVFKMTHDRQVDWLLPGVPPTGKHLQVPFTSIVAIRGDRLAHEHIHWDQATALKQAGLLPEWVPFPYAVEGAEGKRFEISLPVVGVEGAKKLVEEGSLESNTLMGKRLREVSNQSV